jgi:hypothetical protein
MSIRGADLHIRIRASLHELELLNRRGEELVFGYHFHMSKHVYSEDMKPQLALNALAKPLDFLA